MAHLFDFGLSQEDPLSEQGLLQVQLGDRILSVASGGEVPLSLLALNENIHVTAVDISKAQIHLCRLKFLAALYIEFPLNGQFLGFAPMAASQRKELYQTVIRAKLGKDEILFWDQNLPYIEKGIIHFGRFEQYMRKMRFVARLLIGGKNLSGLIACQTLDEQQMFFEVKIASRKALQWLFKIAFHPKLYKNRGLQEQALIHANKSTGERFYGKFRDFCTGSLARKNYFLHYFLTGRCQTEESYPEFLQPENRERLEKNRDKLELAQISFQQALLAKKKGHFNKIHFSNLGDWLMVEEFDRLLNLLKNQCSEGTKISYRFLQKDHLAVTDTKGFLIDRAVSEEAMEKDRFPFYTMSLLNIQGE